MARGTSPPFYVTHYSSRVEYDTKDFRSRETEAVVPPRKIATKLTAASANSTTLSVKHLTTASPTSKLTRPTPPPPRTTTTSRTVKPTTTATSPKIGRTAPSSKPKQLSIAFVLYKKISLVLMQHLSDSEKAKVEVTEEDLIEWYTKQNKEDFASDEELQRMVSIIIGRLIENEGSVAVARQAVDSSRPERRVLMISGK